MNLATALAAGHRAEVDFSGTVASTPRFFFGTRTRCEHEAFVVRAPQGSVDVIDNVGLAPPIKVQPGDWVAVRGEFVQDSHEAIVHWTHHDPTHRHVDGFIRFHGQTYA